MANKTVYPFGTDGQLPSSIGVINDLITGGADKALSAEMGVELNKRLNTFPVATLDSIAFEGKTYREIFEGASSFYFDAESPFGAVAVEEYLNQSSGNIPVRQQGEVDSGTYSLYCHSEVGKSSCLRQKSNNSRRLKPQKTYYIACRMNVTTLPSATRCGVIAESAWVIEQYGVTDGWATFSSTHKNNNASYEEALYFGVFASAEGEMYLDTLVCVPVDIFTNAPTQAQWDAMYNEYVAIKKHLDDSLCMKEFMSAMNAKAVKLGMTDSTFSNPYGGDKYGYNWTTVEDMMKMMVYATSYPRVLDYMSQNTQVTFQIYGNNARSEVCPLTANSFLDGVANAYTAKHGSGSTMPYQALSHKGAGWGDLNHKDATSKVRGCVGTAIVGTHHVAYCVFQAASAYQSSGTYYRAIVDLLDICKTYFDGGDISGMDVSNYNYAMAVELPLLNPECYKNNLSLNTIYLKRVLSNGEEVKFNTASAAKVLSTMVMLDALGDDLHQVIDVNSYDEDTDGTFWSPNDSEPLYIYAGDKLTLGSSMYGILWWSNGVITLATARKAGGKMLYDKLLKGIN